SWSGTEAITRRIAEGEAADVVINAVQNIERQAQDGTLVAASCTDFARVGIGVAVPAAAASLEVSTPEALRAGLLSARSVIVS
ncbi:substrate-binding domain-containing protein, partial [Acinetobacter baumannii]